MNTRTIEHDVNTALDDWRLYEGVRTRRVMAFLIDYLIVALLTVPVAIAIFFLGIVTLGLAWALFAVIVPLVALGYVALTMGGPKQATKGMEMMDIRLQRLDGAPVDGLFAVVHSVLFWAFTFVLSPVVLVATFLLDRKRTIHDLLLGSVVVRTSAPDGPEGR